LNPPEPPSPTGPESRPGTGTFTIEGRSAPGLFVVGWLASLVGIGTIVVALMSGESTAARVLFLAGLVLLSVGLVAGSGGQAIERRARATRSYTGPSPFLLFAAAIPISGLLLFLAGALLGVAGLPVDGPVGRLVSVSLQALVYVGLIRLLVVDGGSLGWADMGLRRPAAGVLAEMARGALWAAPVILATLPLAYLISRLIPVTPVSPLPPTGESVGFAINLLAGAVVAPLSEEILFRGFSTTAWMRDMGRDRGLVRGALFFAVVHVLTISGSTAGEAGGAALAAFIGRLPVAFALGWLFTRRGTIWAPLGLHAACNGLLLVLAEVAARSGAIPVG
jgi:membrane protease YdiL (CAAX protease family)